LLQLEESKADMEAVMRAIVGASASWPRRRTGLRGMTLCAEKNTPICFKTLSREGSTTRASNSSSRNTCTSHHTVCTRIACFRASFLRLSSPLCLPPNGSLPSRWPRLWPFLKLAPHFKPRGGLSCPIFPCSNMGKACPTDLFLPEWISSCFEWSVYLRQSLGHLHC
jgi:hypothetical protein